MFLGSFEMTLKDKSNYMSEFLIHALSFWVVIQSKALSCIIKVPFDLDPDLQGGISSQFSTLHMHMHFPICC